MERLYKGYSKRTFNIWRCLMENSPPCSSTNLYLATTSTSTMIRLLWVAALSKAASNF
jgi:hypothetical protein